jgi:hypothetical protein
VSFTRHDTVVLRGLVELGGLNISRSFFVVLSYSHFTPPPAQEG